MGELVMTMTAHSDFLKPQNVHVCFHLVGISNLKPQKQYKHREVKFCLRVKVVYYAKVAG